MSLEDAWELMHKLDEPKKYYLNGSLHGVMGSVLTDTTRTVYSTARDNRFTTAMLRDLMRYRNDDRDLCLVSDEPTEFERLRQLLEQRYNFICVIEDGVMYSFHFKE